MRMTIVKSNVINFFFSYVDLYFTVFMICDLTVAWRSNFFTFSSKNDGNIYFVLIIKSRINRFNLTVFSSETIDIYLFTSANGRLCFRLSP